MNEPVKGRRPTDEEIFYIEWAKETVKKNIDTANSVLSQFLTLNTALVAGGAIFGPEGQGSVIQLFYSGAFLIALVLAFLGILPHESKANALSPSSIKSHKAKALCKKRAFVWACAIFTSVGLLIFVLSVYIYPTGRCSCGLKRCRALVGN